MNVTDDVTDLGKGKLFDFPGLMRLTSEIWCQSQTKPMNRNLVFLTLFRHNWHNWIYPKPLFFQATPRFKKFKPLTLAPLHNGAPAGISATREVSHSSLHLLSILCHKTFHSFAANNLTCSHAKKIEICRAICEILVSACMAWIRRRLSIRDMARGPKEQIWAKSAQ